MAEYRGFEGRQASACLRRSTGSVANKTADARCFPCVLCVCNENANASVTARANLCARSFHKTKQHTVLF